MAYTSLQITPTSLQELLQSSGQEVQGGALLVGFVEGKSCEFDGRKKKTFSMGKLRENHEFPVKMFPSTNPMIRGVYFCVPPF
jgi:hypothetical protein